MQYMNKVTVTGLGEVPHAQYTEALERIDEIIRGFARIDERIETDPDTIVYAVESEADGLWNLHIQLDEVTDQITSLGYEVVLDPPTPDQAEIEASIVTRTLDGIKGETQIAIVKELTGCNYDEACEALTAVADSLGVTVR